MTTTSYPAVGDGGLGADAWAATFGSRDGIVEDYGGTPGAFAMTLLNATDEAQFSAGKISNNGYTLVVPDGERVSLPAPTSGSKTYYIGSLYDPALNVALAGTDPPLADPQGPCRLMAYDTTVDTSNGKRFLIQYQVTRTSAALTSATVQDRRRWVGDSVIEYDDGVGSDSFPANEGTYPRGTLRIGTNRFLLRTVHPTNGTLSWIDPLLSGPFAFPAPSGLISRDAAPSAPQYLRYAGSMVSCRGTLKRATGANLSTGSNVILGTMPVGYRPPFGCRFTCATSSGWAVVAVGSDGVVTMNNPPTSCTWIDLSAITFRAEK